MGSSGASFGRRPGERAREGARRALGGAPEAPGGGPRAPRGDRRSGAGRRGSPRAGGRGEGGASRDRARPPRGGLVRSVEDLRALVDDDLRRGQPSAHVRFGEGVAILAGDALLTEAFRLVLGYPAPDPARELALATIGMIGGQYVDVTTDGELDGEALAELHRLKTGRLLEACIACALAVAEIPSSEREPWRAFARELGLLFQIVDDILDATGTAAELGKTPGKDEAAGKVTYVSLHGLERARELADEARGRVNERLDALPADTSVLAELVSAIRERHA